MNNLEFVQGILIISKYIPTNHQLAYDVQAEHEQLWFGEYDWITDEYDIQRLFDLGWFKDNRSWSCYC